MPVVVTLLPSPPAPIVSLVEDAISKASLQWRVPKDLVSAMLAASEDEASDSRQKPTPDEYARRLAIAWNRSPIIGNGNLEDGVGIFESWYFALGRAGTGKDGQKANQYAETVLDKLAHCLWSTGAMALPRDNAAQSRQTYRRYIHSRDAAGLGCS